MLLWGNICYAKIQSNMTFQNPMNQNDNVTCMHAYLRKGRRRDMIWRMFLDTTVGPQHLNCSNLRITCWYTASYARRSWAVNVTGKSCSVLGGSLNNSLPLNFCCFVCRIIIYPSHYIPGYQHSQSFTSPFTWVSSQHYPVTWQWEHLCVVILTKSQNDSKCPLVDT